MSREIKFRAWDENLNIMRYDVTGFECGCDSNPVIEGVFLDGDYYSLTGSILHHQAKIMQFTGLLDKNGKEIFESDLCLINEIAHRIEYIQEFMTYCPFTKDQWTWYNEGSNHFKYCYEESHLIDGTFHFLSQLESYEIEIIGNIHTTPELLK